MLGICGDHPGLQPENKLMERTADRNGSLPFDRSRLVESVLVLPGFIGHFIVLALFARGGTFGAISWAT
jgi:hypothetical protein